MKGWVTIRNTDETCQIFVRIQGHILAKSSEPTCKSTSTQILLQFQIYDYKRDNIRITLYAFHVAKFH